MRGPTAAPPVTPDALRRHWRTDALVLAIATIVIRIPAFVAEKSLVFDDGVFASSARAMRNGELPFRDIFSSQGPVFLPFLWVADLVGLAHDGRAAPAVGRRRACCSPSRSTRAHVT